MKVAIPWWKSKVIVGGAISVLATLAKAVGVTGDIPDETLTAVTDAVLTLVAAGGALTAVGARVTQKEAPLITGSNAGAELIKDAVVATELAAEVTETASGRIDDLKLEVPSWMQR